MACRVKPSPDPLARGEAEAGYNNLLLLGAGRVVRCGDRALHRYRAGVEPAGARRKVSDQLILLPRTSHGARSIFNAD